MESRPGRDQEVWSLLLGTKEQSSFHGYTPDEKGEGFEVEAVTNSWELNTVVSRAQPSHRTDIIFVTKVGYLPGRGSRRSHLGDLNRISEWSTQLERHLLKQSEPTTFDELKKSLDTVQPPCPCLCGFDSACVCACIDIDFIVR